MYLDRKQEKRLKDEIRRNTGIIDRVKIWLDSREIKSKAKREEYYFWNCSDAGTAEKSDYKFAAFRLLKDCGVWL